MGGGSNHGQDTYHLNTIRPEWFYNMWESQDRASDDFELELALNRLNMERVNEVVDYISIPYRKQVSSFAYCLEGGLSSILARDRGWTQHFPQLGLDSMTKV